MCTSIHTHKNMERICCYRIDGAKTKGLKTSTPISVISSNHSQAELTTVHLKSSLRSPTPVTTRRNRCRPSASQTIPWLGRWSLFHVVSFSEANGLPLFGSFPFGKPAKDCHSPAPGCCTAAAQPWSVNHQLPLHSLIRRHFNISLTRRKACWSSSSWSHLSNTTGGSAL